MGYSLPAHGTSGTLPDGQSCWDAAVSWWYRVAIAPRTPHPAWLARNKSWPKWSRSPSVPSPWSKWARSPQVLILQYFQIHRSYQNAWSFSISRFTGHTRKLGPSVFPDSEVLRMLGPLMPKSISSDNQNKRYKFRHPRYKFRHHKYKFRHPKYSQTLKVWVQNIQILTSTRGSRPENLKFYFLTKNRDF